MKKFIYIGIVSVLTSMVTSCGTVETVKNSDSEVAGYTLKNKKELMQQKILNSNSKTIIAIP